MPPTKNQALLALARRIDELCDRFKAEWLGGNTPRVEAYLAAAPEADREPLRGALLAVEKSWGAAEWGSCFAPAR